MMAPYSASNNANAAGMASAHAPPVSHTPDGAAQALEAQTKAYQNRYAAPIGGDAYANANDSQRRALATNGMPSHYNVEPAPATKYTQDSAAKEHFRDKETIIAGINAAKAGGSGPDNVQRVVQVGEAEVELMREARRTAELANFDRYVYSLVDPRQPGSLKWLNEVYPEFVARRIEQVQTDYEFSLRNQLIDQWGINDFSDLKFKYMVDQGIIDGPMLKNKDATVSNYTPGYLAPWKFAHWLNTEAEQGGLKLPFSSAEYGKRPANKGDWSFSNANAPLGGSRDSLEYAQALFRKEGTAAQNVGRPGYTVPASGSGSGSGSGPSG